MISENNQHCAKAKKFKRNGGQSRENCSSCFKLTKYTCLGCKKFFCITCSVFDTDEDTLGWKAGSSVAHYEACFQDKMEQETANSTIANSGSNIKDQSLEGSNAEKVMKRFMCNFFRLRNQKMFAETIVYKQLY